MLLKAVTVYDSKAQVYFQPFFVNQVGAAIRSFGDEANKADGPIGKHPGDYQLYEIGSYEDTTAVLKPLVPMRLLGSALEFVDFKNKYKFTQGGVDVTDSVLEKAEAMTNGTEKA